ncbi:MAG: hypothetical protein AABY40_01335 [Nanoarchaeota archaeon]
MLKVQSNWRVLVLDFVDEEMWIQQFSNSWTFFFKFIEYSA